MIISTTTHGDNCYYIEKAQDKNTQDLYVYLIILGKVKTCGSYKILIPTSPVIIGEKWAETSKAKVGNAIKQSLSSWYQCGGL